jgi:hypothetical protein
MLTKPDVDSIKLLIRLPKTISNLEEVSYFLAAASAMARRRMGRSP